jgi:uncharacterized protein (TIGR02594 family)
MSIIIKPKWIAEAERHLGTTEIKGSKHTAEIVGWWKAIKLGGIKDDETPWCAAFVGACLEASGIRSTRSAAARSYCAWGRLIRYPTYGCIVVFTRAGGGHVGFVVGQDKTGNLLVLGGNQGDAVNIKSFSRTRVLSYRWPEGEPLPQECLPIASAEFSIRES